MNGWLSVAVGFLLVVLSTAECQFKKFGVIPDVVDGPPKALLEIKFDSGVSAFLGNMLTPTEVKNQPTLSWPTEDGTLYTLIGTDPDVPSRRNATMGEFLHFLITNVPGNDLSKGDVLFGYIGSGPPKDTGLHRYVWLVYKQPGNIVSTQKHIPSSSIENRPKFSTRKFLKEHNLETLAAGNFFQAEYDDYVPILMSGWN